MTGGSSSGHGVKPDRGVRARAVRDRRPARWRGRPRPRRWLGRLAAHRARGRATGRAAPALTAPDPAAEVAATAPTMTLTARTSEIVTVLGTCASLIGAVQRFLPDVRFDAGEAALGFPLQPGPSRTDIRP